MSHRFRISLLLATLISASASHAVAQSSNDAAERQILRLEAEAREATLKNDLEANDRLLADDWINITLIMNNQERKERSQSGGEDEVRLIHKVDAAYPQEAKDKAVEGKVIVEFTIDEKGDLTDARVKEGPEPLRRAALDAARQARFSNPLKREFSGTLAYDFRLGEDKRKTSSPAAQQAALNAPAEEQRIKLIERVEPVYPREAEEKGVTGKVTVEITINEKGEVSEAKVKEGPKELHQAAIDAVRQWRFSNPAKQKAVATITFNFEP